MGKYNIRVSGDTRPHKELFKHRGLKWNADKQRWWCGITDFVAAQLLSGDMSILETWPLRQPGCVVCVGDTEIWRSETYREPTASSQATPTIRVSKSRRENLVGSVVMVAGVPNICIGEVRAYRFTDGLSTGHGRDEGWCHEVTVRPMTSDEIAARDKARQIAELERKLEYYEGPADDVRSEGRFAEEAQLIRDQLQQLRG